MGGQGASGQALGRGRKDERSRRGPHEGLHVTHGAARWLEGQSFTGNSELFAVT